MTRYGDMACCPGQANVLPALNESQEPATTAPSPCKKEEEQPAGGTPLRHLIPHPKGVWVFRHGLSGSKERRGTNNGLIPRPFTTSQGCGFFGTTVHLGSKGNTDEPITGLHSQVCGHSGLPPAAGSEGWSRPLSSKSFDDDR